MTLSPWRTLQNVIQTQKCELCQLNKPTTPFPAGGFPPDTASSTRPKAQAWPQFNRHALKELLDDRLECFDKSNRALRALLRNQQEQQISTAKLSEQRDVLLARLAHLQDAHHVCFESWFNSLSEIIQPIIVGDNKVWRNEYIVKNSNDVLILHVDACIFVNFRFYEAICLRVTIKLPISGSSWRHRRFVIFKKWEYNKLFVTNCLEPAVYRNLS